MNILFFSCIVYAKMYRQERVNSMPTAKYESIYEDMKQKIEEGLYPSEAVFPSESELTAAYACSRATLRRALARLIEHGYIQAGQGRRMRVIYQPTEQNEFMIGGIESFREAVPDLTPEIAAHSIYDYIENDLGMTIVTSRRRMTVERAGALDMRWLEMGDYNCLAVVSGRTYNAEGVQFEYTQSRHHPEYFCFEDTAVRRNVR